MKRVSVVLPVFNERLDNLSECINSILGQTYNNIELIIVDDSDDENIIGYLKSIADGDKRVLYVKNPERLGLARSLNKGLSFAKGDYIARADSDDIQHPDRFKIQVDYLERNSDIGIVGSSFEKIENDGKVKNIRYYPLGNSLVKQMMIKSAIAHPTVMMRKSMIDLLGRYDESFKKAEDYELWMRAIKKEIKIENIPEPLIKYRLSDTEKRDNLHWINNIKVKVRYFGFDYLGYRLIGILAVSFMIVIPNFLKRFFYNLYNKIA